MTSILGYNFNEILEYLNNSSIQLSRQFNIDDLVSNISQYIKLIYFMISILEYHYNCLNIWIIH